MAAAAAAVAELQPAEVALATGGFHPLSRIGEGGFGTVYRGMLHHRPVAIKVMAADSLQGQAEFENEAGMLGRLSHAHLVRLLGVCRSGPPAPLRCLVYELMPGGNVEEQLGAAGGRCVLPWWLRVRVAAQAAAAVAYLHSLPASQGGPVLHRDIKPANVFLDGHLNAKLGDFGLAARALQPAAAGGGVAAAAAAAAGVSGEAMVGTFAYLPPEYRASGAQGVKGDVYALGVSLLQLATGALDQLHQLLPRAREAAAAGAEAAALDAAAGAWDEFAGRRLVQLGLWACSDAPDARPAAPVLAHELSKLWLATDQVLRAQQQQQQPLQEQEQQQQLAVLPAGGAAWGARAPPAPADFGPLGGLGPQQQELQQQRQQGGGGGFWRFLTASSSGGR